MGNSRMVHEPGGEDVYGGEYRPKSRWCWLPQPSAQREAGFPLAIPPLFCREWVFLPEFLSMAELQQS